MLNRLRTAGLIWPTLAALACLIGLIGLGNWQWQRKIWKEGLLGEIAASVKAAPISLAEIDRRAASGTRVEFQRIAVEGRFLHAHERHVWAPHPPVKGWIVFTPLLVEGARLVWINRGTIPEHLKEAYSRASGQIAGEAKVVGVVRMPEPTTAFTPENDAARNRWYRRDHVLFQASLPGVGDAIGRATPAYYIEAEAEPANPGGWPKGGGSRASLSNRHLEYAVTWFGLAGTLVGVYIAFAVGRLRRH